MTRTVGAAAFNAHLRDMIAKHAPDRSWGSLATIVPQSDRTLGLLIDGDPAPFLAGQWYWQLPLTLMRAVFDAATSTWSTAPGGADNHTHALTLPDELWQALRPPQANDRVWVEWMDQGQQSPMVTGIVLRSPPAPRSATEF